MQVGDTARWYLPAEVKGKNRTYYCPPSAMRQWKGNQLAPRTKLHGRSLSIPCPSDFEPYLLFSENLRVDTILCLQTQGRLDHPIPEIARNQPKSGAARPPRWMVSPACRLRQS